MVRTHKSLFAAEDLYSLPDDNQKYELVHGHLVSEPLPGARHGRVATNIVFALQTWVRNAGDGVVYTCDTGFVLERNPDTVRGPDVAFVSGRRARHAVDESRYIEGAPDLAVEILSPGNRRGKMQAKVTNYLAAGASLVWVVNPQRESVIVHMLNETITLSGDDSLTSMPLLQGFRLKVSEIF